jgi:hypothetical protein
MKKLVFGVIVLLAAVSCTPEQLARMDKAVADANLAAQGGAAIASGPAGPLLPANVRAILELVGIGGAATAIFYQRLRASGVLVKKADLAMTLAAVVDAIDQTDPQHAAAVKGNVKALMKSRQIFNMANAVVDENRSAKTA